jgi:rare lipoprotein A (peptidoglycan hydrolase)
VRKTFTGRGAAGRVVTIERYDEIAGQWSAITHTTAKSDGTFRARWKPDRAGAARVRARVEAPDAQAATAAPELAITLYTPAKATWYGPGFYGRKTACGAKLSKTLVGVAHKSLPCGTKVTFLYKGRTLTVPVVDRGPFANGAKWDLTGAAAQQLGVTATVRLGRLIQAADSR